MSYTYLSSFDAATIEKFTNNALAAGSAIKKSANFTREFFAMFPKAVGNVNETQALCAMLPGLGSFADMKKDGEHFKQTFAGLDNALRKGTTTVAGHNVLWKGESYNHRLCLAAIALCEAARKQAAGANKAEAPEFSRAQLVALFREACSLLEGNSANIDKVSNLKRIAERIK